MAYGIVHLPTPYVVYSGVFSHSICLSQVAIVHLQPLFIKNPQSEIAIKKFLFLGRLIKKRKMSPVMKVGLILKYVSSKIYGLNFEIVTVT